ncbi:hypothetical protein Tco_0276678 [Tanacetum coccineum]
MKDLVENKPRTKEDEGNRMNPRCSALLQNIYPLRNKIQEVSFSLVPFRKLDFNNALADLGASINLMPLSQYFLILDMVEDLRMPIILGRPLLATAHAKVDIFRKSISLEVGSEKVLIQTFFSYEIDVQESYEEIIYRITEVEKEKQSRPKERRVHWYKAILQEKENGSEFGDEEDDLEENLEDPEECGEDKANTIIGAIHDKLNDDWFNNTSEDEDDLEGILDYLEPRSYDGFIDLDDEAYNKRRIPRQKFKDLPLEQDILSLIRDLGHTGDITYLTDVNVDYLNQPWREFATFINKCLSGKETGMDKIRLFHAQIL